MSRRTVDRNGDDQENYQMLEQEGPPPLLSPLNEYVEAEHTSYEEVDGVVSNEDDQTMLCSTFRAWFLGISFVIFFGFINAQEHYQKKGFSLSGAHVFLVSFLLGKAMAYLLPSKSFRIWPGSSQHFSFNPGPFAIKEHVLIVLMVEYGSITLSPGLFDMNQICYRKQPNLLWFFVFMISVELIGCGIAGVMRRFLVWPASMTWPSLIPEIVLFRTLHETTADRPTHSSTGRWEMKRCHFFFVALLCQFFYSWIPTFFMPILTTFAWVCFLNPDKHIWTQITGAWKFGVGALSLDWDSMGNKIRSPLVVPGWAQANIAFGFVFITWIVSPVLYFSNVWNMQKFPMRMSDFYAWNGSIYNLKEVLISAETPDQVRLNTSAFEDYGSPYFNLSFVVSYACQLALIPALFVHTLLYHGRDLLKQYRTSLQNRDNDIHCSLMARYKETPEWWFTILFVLALALAMLACYNAELMPFSHLLFITLAILILVLPMGIVIARTGITIGVIHYPVVLLLAGLLLPYMPLAEKSFDQYLVGSVFAAIKFISFFKYSHYMKIPPQVVFIAIITCLCVSDLVSFVAFYPLRKQLITKCTDELTLPKNYGIDVVNDLEKIQKFAVIGWSTLLGYSSRYFPLLGMLLAGAILPVIFWYLDNILSDRFRWLRHIHVPIILMPGILLDANGGLLPTYLLIGLVCNVCLSRWVYGRYIRLLSTATDQAIALSVLARFFILKRGQTKISHWWGTGMRYEQNCLNKTV